MAKAALVDGLVNDALTLLAAFEDESDDEATRPSAAWPSWPAKTSNKTTTAPGRSPSKVATDRVISTVDPEARHMHKSRSEYRDGYKAHIAVEPETGLVDRGHRHPGQRLGRQDRTRLVDLEPDGLEVLADSAYGSGETRAHLRAHGHRQLIKPIPLRRAVRGGFTVTISPSITKRAR